LVDQGLDGPQRVICWNEVVQPRHREQAFLHSIRSAHRSTAMSLRRAQRTAIQRNADRQLPGGKFNSLLRMSVGSAREGLPSAANTRVQGRPVGRGWSIRLENRLGGAAPAVCCEVGSISGTKSRHRTSQADSLMWPVLFGHRLGS
jgi:hypothetical protein